MRLVRCGLPPLNFVSSVFSVVKMSFVAGGFLGRYHQPVAVLQQAVG